MRVADEFICTAGAAQPIILAWPCIALRVLEICIACFPCADANQWNQPRGDAPGPTRSAGHAEIAAMHSAVGSGCYQAASAAH